MTKIKLTAVCAALLLVLLVLPGCSSSQYKDGDYTASMPDFSENGWKDTMELTIENGEIVKIDWDAVYRDDSIPVHKKQYSKSGLYGMLQGGAIDEWYDQAIAAEQFVLENGIDALQIKPDGFTDAVTGCTVEVGEFDHLVRECLRQAQK